MVAFFSTLALFSTQDELEPDAKQLGQYYESIATPIESSTPDIMEYRNAVT